MEAAGEGSCRRSGRRPHCYSLLPANGVNLRPPSITRRPRNLIFLDDYFFPSSPPPPLVRTTTTSSSSPRSSTRRRRLRQQGGVTLFHNDDSVTQGDGDERRLNSLGADTSRSRRDVIVLAATLLATKPRSAGRSGLCVSSLRVTCAISKLLAGWAG